MHTTLIILLAVVAWVFLGAILFFNPFIDKFYKHWYGHPQDYPAMNAVPKTPGGIGIVILTNIVKCTGFALAYLLIKDGLPTGVWQRTLSFGTLIFLIRIIPGQADFAMLTTYPKKAIAIEGIIFGIGGYVIAYIYSVFL